MARVFLLLALAVKFASSICVDPSCFTSLTWTTSGGNITFNGTCSAQPIGDYPVTWCAFGISPSGLMFPAEAFILQINNGAVVVEDRNNVAHAVPACYATQISSVLSSSVSSSNSSFTATWTRPINLTSSLISEGYLNIPVGPTSVISAILYALPPAYKLCSLSLIEHASASTANVTLL